MLTTACADDDTFSTSRTDVLDFSVDTVKMDTVFTTVGSSTYTFWVYNRGDKALRIGSVRLKQGNQTGFRVNVDGTYLDNTTGSIASNLEVRSGDSLRVFVELTAPANHHEEAQLVEDDLLFSLESGVEQKVCLYGYAWDALTLTDLSVHSDTTIETNRPLVVYGRGIVVDSGAVLTLRNTTLYFHQQAGITVNGTLATDHVVMRGDRLDHMFDYLPYDRVNGQWQGIVFSPTSAKGNVMTDTEVRNATTAIELSDSAATDSTVPRLTMQRCVVHNSAGDGVVAYNSYVVLSHCQLTNAQGDCLALYGGKADIDHCTLAQFCPFSAARGYALRFADRPAPLTTDLPTAEAPASQYPLLRLTCNGTIVTGYNADVVLAERTDTAEAALSYLFADCLLRTPAVEDDTISFRSVRWETPADSIQGKQHFVLIDEENLAYDFHLDSLSTAHGLGCYPDSTKTE